MKMHSKETPQKKTNKIRWKSNKNSVKLDLQKKKIGEASTRAAVDGRLIPPPSSPSSKKKSLPSALKKNIFRLPSMHYDD